MSNATKEKMPEIFSQRQEQMKPTHIT